MELLASFHSTSSSYITWAINNLPQKTGDLFIVATNTEGVAFNDNVAVTANHCFAITRSSSPSYSYNFRILLGSIESLNGVFGTPSFTMVKDYAQTGEKVVYGFDSQGSAYVIRPSMITSSTGPITKISSYPGYLTRYAYVKVYLIN